MSEAPEAVHDITTALQQHEPMATNWLLVFETSELDSHGDIESAWGVLASSPSSVAHIGLAELARERLHQSFTDPWEDE